MKKLYMKVTKDRFELPLAVAESAEELAEMVGNTKGTIQSCISHKHKGWVRVLIPDDDWEENDDQSEGQEA